MYFRLNLRGAAQLVKKPSLSCRNVAVMSHWCKIENRKYLREECRHVCRRDAGYSSEKGASGSLKETDEGWIRLGISHMKMDAAKVCLKTSSNSDLPLGSTFLHILHLRQGKDRSRLFPS